MFLPLLGENIKNVQETPLHRINLEPEKNNQKTNGTAQATSTTKIRHENFGKSWDANEFPYTQSQVVFCVAVSESLGTGIFWIT